MLAQRNKMKGPAVGARKPRVECVTHVTRFRRVEQEKPVPQLNPCDYTTKEVSVKDVKYSSLRADECRRDNPVNQCCVLKWIDCHAPVTRSQWPRTGGEVPAICVKR